MEETIVGNENVSQIILNTINELFENLFSSIDNSVYTVLDDLVFIDLDIFSDNFFSKIFGTSSTNGLLLIANSLLIAFTLYYCFKLLYSNFSASQIERPYQFVFKLLIFGIIINCSYFICQHFVYINSLISSSICEIGTSIFGENISFASLVQNLNSVVSIEQNSFNLFSFDGLIKSFVSMCLFNLLFSYALRYIMVKVFLLLTPFAFLSLVNHSTSWFFKIWLRSMLSLLILQSFVAIILLIVFALDFNSTNVLSKLLCIGSIYALSKANSYIRDLFGGISTDVTNNINMMKSFIKPN